MVNGLTFNAPNAKAFHESLKLLAPTTDRIPGVKEDLPAVMRTVEQTLEVFGGSPALTNALGGEPPTHFGRAFLLATSAPKEITSPTHRCPVRELDTADGLEI